MEDRIEKIEKDIIKLKECIQSILTIIEHFDQDISNLACDMKKRSTSR